MKTLALRDYQEAAIDAVYEAWDNGYRRPAVVLPTGMGKTVIFADLVRRSTETASRALILVHRDELVRQTVDKIGMAAPGALVGVIKAERHEWVGYDVVVASVQTLSRQARLDSIPASTFDLVIVDECHHAAANSYIKVLEHFGCFELDDSTYGHARAVGFTATLTRNDELKLSRVWETVAYQKDILHGIAAGHLADVKGFQVTVDGLDLATLARRRGDFAEGELGEAMVAAGAGQVIAEAYAEHGSREDGSYRPGILFAPTVSSAYAFADALNDAGISAETVVGETTPSDRQLIYKRVRAGETTVLCSCMVLTEGFDMPEVEVAVVARPTTAPSLYVQMVGRVLRPAPWTGKSVATVLDVVGVSNKLALATLSDLSVAKASPEPGETLLNAAVRAEKEQREEFGELVSDAGPSLSQVVDLFHSSQSVWLRTKAGRWFIPTRESLVFLHMREDGLFDVGATHSPYRTAPARRLHSGLGIEMAMSWGEREAQDMDESVSQKTSSWRANSRKPSDAQVELAKRLGVETDGLNRGRLSDAISIVYASRALDRKVK